MRAPSGNCASARGVAEVPTTPSANRSANAFKPHMERRVFARMLLDERGKMSPRDTPYKLLSSETARYVMQRQNEMLLSVVDSDSPKRQQPPARTSLSAPARRFSNRGRSALGRGSPVF